MAQMRSYFSVSWEMLTRDAGWIKPVLLLTAAMVVPIAGPLFALGYALEWARLTAWGVDSAPKQRNIGYGECIKSGWRGFVISFVYSAVCAMLMQIVNTFFGNIPVIGEVLAIASILASIAATILGYIASLRATIYQRIGAGFQIERIWEMVSADNSGPIALFSLSVVWALVSGIISGLAVAIFTITSSAKLIPALRMLFEVVRAREISRSELVYIVEGLTTGAAPMVIALTVFTVFSATLLLLVLINATGIWMRQFDVPRWGQREDPLPTTPAQDGSSMFFT